MLPDDYLVCYEYVSDVLSWIKQREVEMDHLQLVAPQLNRRRQLINWTCSMASDLKISTLTVHLAIKLLDHFMSGHDIEEAQLFLVCLGCLQLASKVIEKESSVPTTKSLQAMLPHPLPISSFFHLEGMMLDFFMWDINYPTCCYVIEILLPLCIHPLDIQFIHYRGNQLNFQAAKEGFFFIVKEMLDFCIQEESLMLVVPSILACAVLQASRIQCGLVPSWPTNVATVSGYSNEQIDSVTDSLVSLHKLHSDDENMLDEGYQSNLSSGLSPEKLLPSQ